MQSRMRRTSVKGASKYGWDSDGYGSPSDRGEGSKYKLGPDGLQIVENDLRSGSNGSQQVKKSSLPAKVRNRLSSYIMPAESDALLKQRVHA